MAKSERYTTQQIIDALHEADGYVAKTASILHCNPSTVYNYSKRYPSVAAAWEDIREARHDHVENALMKLIDSGNATAIIFYLKTQCKSRGYIERQQIEHSGGVDVAGLSDEELRSIIAGKGRGGA